MIRLIINWDLSSDEIFIGSFSYACFTVKDIDRGYVFIFFKKYLSGISQVLYTAEETLKTDEEANKVNIYVICITLKSAG